MKISAKTATKFIACFLAAAVSMSSVFIISYAEHRTASDSTDAEVSAATASLDAYAQMPSGNDETVYVIANADGSVKKVIVSSWLKNASGADSLKDTSNLNDTENAKSDETYTMDSDNMRIWNAGGKDIYMRGTSTETLPVDVSIRYYLDGEEISAEKIAGQSGHVKISFTYSNNEKRTVKAGGNKYTMYVPFAALTGTVLDNDLFSNVTVSNGKVITDGDKVVAIGYALPGLKESLGINDDDIEIPTDFVLEADVTDFKLSATMTLVTNELFNAVDMDGIKDIDDLTGSVGELTDASRQLCDGSSKLYDGISELLTKSDELINGINQLYAGAELVRNGAGSVRDGAKALALGASDLKYGSGALKDGSAALKDGSSALRSGAGQIKDGSSELYIGIAKADAGLQQLVNNNDSLTSGAKTVFESLIDAANAQLAGTGLDVPVLTIDNYHEALESLIDSLDENKVREIAYKTALKKVTEEVEANRELIREQVKEAYRQQITEAVLQSIGQPMTYDEYKAAVASGLIPAETQAAVNAAVEAKLQSYIDDGTIEAAVDAKIKELIDETMNSSEVQAEIDAAVAKAQAGKGSIQTLLEQLDSYNEFYNGLISYTQGVSKIKSGTEILTEGADDLKYGSSNLYDGANSIYNGADALYQGTDVVDQGAGALSDGAYSLYRGSDSLFGGAEALYNGIGELVNGSAKLKDGVTRLHDGSGELHDGMTEFDKMGIKKIADAVGDADELIEKLRALSEISADYNSFVGNGDIEDSTVRFIYKTDSID